MQNDNQGRALMVLPIGFQQFHRRSFVNYQLNRAHALGFADAAELRAAALRVHRPRDCPTVFDAMADEAERAGRVRSATGYARIAEFFTPGGSPAKVERYRRFLRLFDTGFQDAGHVRHHVAYGEAALPAYRLPAIGGPARGTVLIHGGFDSLIEEFFAVWERIALAGFDVIAFDGPGQGGARRLAGITFDHDWEKPVGAVLDHFAVESAALVGMSMGGYWALRAAGRENRIDRVVSWPPVYDWRLRIPTRLRPAAEVMFDQRRFMRFSIRARAALIPTLRMVVDQTLYNLNSDDPIDVMDWFLSMNQTHLGSARVTQDVLVLCGEHDVFQPPALAYAQAEALTAANSVTVRTFTVEEHADQHCQMGNLGLACRVLIGWLTDPRRPLPEPR